MHIVQSNIGYNVFLDPKEKKFVKFGRLGIDFCLSKRRVFWRRNVILKKIFLMMTSQTPYVTHSG